MSTATSTPTNTSTDNSASTASSTPTSMPAPSATPAGSGPAAPARTAAVPEQRRGSPPPTSSTAPASSAPISASALVQFKVTSHWGDGYRADVTVTDTGVRPLSGWHLTFQVTGATPHEPTDTGEASTHGGVVTVTPAAWRPTPAAGAAATFGMGFDGALAAPADCRIDGAPCELLYVPVADQPLAEH